MVGATLAGGGVVALLLTWIRKAGSWATAFESLTSMVIMLGHADVGFGRGAGQGARGGAEGGPGRDVGRAERERIAVRIAGGGSK